MLGSCTLCSFIMMTRKVLSINVEDTTVYEYLKEYIIFTIENNFLVFMACIIYITFMIGFVFAYLYAKITDINIGLIISLDYGDLFDWMYNQEENKFTIYKKGEYYKEVENFYEIEEIIRWKNYIYSFRCKLTNLLKRLFCRYPLVTFVNIIFIVMIVIILKAPTQ